MSEIERLYYNIKDTSKDYAATEDVNEAYVKMEKAIGDKAICDEIMDYAVANEKQGFIYGFQYAVTLLTGGKAVIKQL